MRISEFCSLTLIITGFLLVAPAVAQKQLARSPRILSAKTVYFDNQTGSDAVGKSTLAQLKKWGKFQLVSDRKQADLIFLLSADPYKGGNIASPVARPAAPRTVTSPKTLCRITTNNLPRDTPT